MTLNYQSGKNNRLTTMNNILKTGFILILTVLSLAACSSSPYGDPDAQRDRSKDAQDEMRRDTSRY